MPANATQNANMWARTNTLPLCTAFRNSTKPKAPSHSQAHALRHGWNWALQSICSAAAIHWKSLTSVWRAACACGTLVFSGTAPACTYVSNPPWLPPSSLCRVLMNLCANGCWHAHIYARWVWYLTNVHGHTPSWQHAHLVAHFHELQVRQPR